MAGSYWDRSLKTRLSRRRAIAVVTSASGGATMAPRTNADAQVNCGAAACAMTATAAVVTNTSATASKKMGRALRRTSRTDPVIAAQKRSGGTKSAKVSPGSSSAQIQNPNPGGLDEIST